MERTTLSVLTELAQKMHNDYFGLEFESVYVHGFSLRGTSSFISISANDYTGGGCLYMSVQGDNNCSISMTNMFDIKTEKAFDFDWLSFSEKLLHQYDTADHRMILQCISNQAKERASKLENNYLEATERINDINNKQQ